MHPFTLIPYLCGAGASRPGCQYGPVDLKNHNFENRLREAGYPVHGWLAGPEELAKTIKHGPTAQKNLPPLGSDARKEIVLYHCRKLADDVENVIRNNALPITIGGDHSMAAGSVAGLVRAKQGHRKTGLIWIDAHPDLNTDETSPSGALHGMPIAALLGLGDPDFAGLSGPKPALRPDHIFYIGIRDIDDGEKTYIKDHNIPRLTGADVRKQGIAQAIDTALKTLRPKVDHLALSFDLDSLDPADAPAVGTPVEGGIPLNDLVPVWQQILREVPFDLIEIAEFNPSLQGVNRTRKAVYNLFGLEQGNGNGLQEHVA